jgi:hypothetical protein
MSQHSEERLPEAEGAPSVRSGARILPFERPQSELQRAIQQRAQETLDLNRERDRETRRPQPLKWLTIFALACIPVLLTLLMVDGFLRVFHKVTEMYSSEPAQQEAAPAATESEPEPVSRPGIVMLESYDVPQDAQRTAPSGSADAPAPAADPNRSVERR